MGSLKSQQSELHQSLEEEFSKLESDLLVQWFCQGLHHILEKIFLSIPRSSVLACKQVFISPTFYVQLLHVQILKAQKDTAMLSVFFVLLGSTHVKAALKMLVKSTPGEQGLAEYRAPLSPVSST